MFANVPKIPSYQKVSPVLLEQEEVWGADLFCGVASQILLGKGPRVALKELGGRCFEGWRVSINPGAWGYDDRIETTPIYRQANLGSMRFKVDPEHWQSPEMEEEWCVCPGDVVLNKLVPIRAVLVGDRVHRHPVDSNCLLIRGLDRPAGVWVAFCLNQKPYEAYLTQHQGLAVLPRASLRELRQLRLPPPPEEMRQLGEQFWAIADGFWEVEAQLARAMAEVEDWVGDDWQQLAGTGDSGRTWGRFLSAKAIEDSLLPGHVHHADLRRQLRSQFHWLPIAKLAIIQDCSRERLNRDLGEIPYLRLQDIDGDLMVNPIAPLPITQATRIFKHPLRKGEVLLSTFAANPRVAFVDRGFEETVYATDNWARLRFKETPAAYALILNAGAIQEQLTGLTGGRMRQFVPSDRVDRLLLPHVPLAQRQVWEQVVLTHHQRKRELNQRWRSLWQRLEALFKIAHEKEEKQA